MKTQSKDYVLKTIQELHLPSYHLIPDVGLYLDQTVKYINTFFKPIPNMELTASMVSNYVKKGILERPVKKVYSRDQICYLIFIMIVKTVLSMENIQLFIEQQKKTYDVETAYEYLCLEMENVKEYVFEMKDKMDLVGKTSSDEKMMLRNAIIIAVHKMHLELCLEAIRQE